jgi:hypothetical protein
MKYRIVIQDGLYIPQKKILFLWTNFYYGFLSYYAFRTLKDVKQFIKLNQ